MTYYKLTTTIQGSGAVNCSGEGVSYKEGSEIVIKATPSEGWYVDAWIVNGEEYNNRKEFTIPSIDNDYDITIIFKEKPQKQPVQVTPIQHTDPPIRELMYDTYKPSIRY